jgi:nicotinamide mononucleotide transporter
LLITGYNCFYMIGVSSLQLIIHYVELNYIEIIASLSGLLYIFFSIRQNILVWPASLIMSLLYIYVYFFSGLFALMSLQFYYLVVSIYGWRIWWKGKSAEGSKLKVVHSTLKQTGLFIAIFIFLSYFIYVLLIKTASDHSLADAIITSASIVATYMLARKIIEHWYIWILVDASSLILYYIKSMYPTMILYLIYTFMAFLGYWEWRKDLLKIDTRL